MATLTVYSGTGDGLIASSSGTYSSARSGAGLTAYTASRLLVGQDAGYVCYESFLRFDTSALTSGATVSAAVISLVLSSDNSATDFTLEARASTWGGTLGTGDWVAGASLSSSTLLASRSTSGMTSVDTRYDLTSDAAFPAGVSKTGNTDVFLSSSRHRGNNTPSGEEYQEYYDAEESGTTKDPRLVVTYTTGVSGTLAVTLDAATLAGTGAIPSKGTLAATLGAATLAGSGTVANTVRTGTLSVTLGAATLSASGTVSGVNAAGEDGLEIGETATAVRYVLASASDGLVLDESTNRGLVAFATATDQLVLDESESFVRTTYSAATDEVILSDDATGLATMLAVAADSLIVSESLSARKLWEPEAEDTATWETQAVSGDIWTPQTTDNATWTPRS